MASVNEPRLYLEEALEEGKSITLGKQPSHYLLRVLRMAPGEAVFPFNEHSGEWEARIVSAGKTAELSLGRKLREPETEGRITLCFAPLKRQQTDLVVQKATELGVAAFRPFLGEHSNTARVRLDRMQSIIREACEQCGRIRPPAFHEPHDLDKVIKTMAGKTLAVFLDETAPTCDGPESLAAMADQQAITLFVGPEGGFSDAERQQLMSLRPGLRLSLGRNRLRAETAALAGLALLQHASGDWSQ